MSEVDRDRTQETSPPPAPGTPRWLHASAVIAAVLTWPLLLVGGSVTVYKVGMAVPDWPTTFGVNMFLYNMLDSSFGVQLEHSHRLLGSALGLVCIVLAGGFLVSERRGWLKALAVLALVLVSLQGVLGGTRVTRNSNTLAFLHGCTAEAVFAFLVALCVLSGRDWSRPGLALGDPSHLRRKSLVTLILVYLQVILGAWVRHYGSNTGVLVHAFLASTVLGHAVAVGVRVLRDRERYAALVPSAWGVLLGVIAQVVLGGLAWWLLRPFDGIPRTVWPGQAALRIAHHGVGALLLASSMVLTLRAYRHLGGDLRREPTGPMVRELEAVS
jgi:cytochrome c oxidase assembly protein subunit 15